MAKIQGRTKKGKMPRCYICGQPYRALSVEKVSDTALCDKHYRLIAEVREDIQCPRNFS